MDGQATRSHREGDGIGTSARAFIAWNQESALVSGLEEVERGVAVLTDSDPVRAAYLYETFIAACYMKANEIHSEWEFGNFVGELASGWIRARQAGGADRLETAKTLLSWIDRDDYGFFNDLGSEAAKVLDPDGLAAFETEVRDRFEKAIDNRSDPSDRRSSERWARILRSIYAQQGRVERYVAVAERTGLTPGDCAAVARILESRRKYGDALLWTERGIAMGDAQTSYSAKGHDLAGMRRTLLRKLGRVQEALESAWAEFVNRPSLFGYEELMRNVPAAGRVAWQERAMATAEQTKLEPFIELCVKAKEIDRLAKRLEYTGDRELEGLSHYVTEPAAEVLRKPYPAVSAKLFRALSIRILRAAKSKYYDAALAHLEDARRCYLAAGLEQQWEVLALEIRRDHFHKSSFMPGFNAIIAGKKMRDGAVFPRSGAPAVGGQGEIVTRVFTLRSFGAQVCHVRMAPVLLSRILLQVSEKADFHCDPVTGFSPWRPASVSPAPPLCVFSQPL